jgi:hypothetical protein
MGITISYRGRLADLSRVEDFEDRLVDLALDFGGQVQIWRSYADSQPQRMIRGVLLNLAPGQETASLLVSPEGWLIGLVDIEDAAEGRLTEPPWCFIKTQFGPLEGHVALVEMFAALEREFLPELEVNDEGGYYPTRDLAELRRRRALVQQGIDGLAEALTRHGLSREAAEDPAIVLQRIERIAAQVHRTLQRPAEHPPVAFPEDEASGEALDPEANEALWDEMFKHNRRQQERLQRAIEERRSRGEEDQAFEHALEDLGLEVPGEDSEEADEPWRDEQEPFAAPDVGDNGQDRASGWADGPEDAAWPADDADPFGPRHPLLQRATEVLKDLHNIFCRVDERFASSVRTLLQGAGDTMGGLAQALSRREDSDDRDDQGIRVTQLKRALRGAAFARGALFLLRDAVPAEQFYVCRHTLEQMEQDIFQELSRLRFEKP